MSKIELDLKNFFVFNTSYGLKEGDEHEKILYYYPEGDLNDIKIKNVGLVEAILQFTSTFKPNKPVNVLHTQKRRQLFYQPEENFWMIMTISNPYTIKIKDNANCIDYLDEDVQDNVYESVLKQSYSMFRLFNGNFKENAKDLVEFKSRLKSFYEEHLAALKLPNCDILNVFNGIQFLPLDRETFVNVQCFLNLLECNFPIIKCSAFLYNEHLIWSGLEPEDMQTVYQYLVTKLLPQQVKVELSGGSLPRHSTPFIALHHGRFIFGPGKDIKDAPMKIHTFHNSKPAQFYMIVYRLLSSSVCMFVDAATELTVELLKSIDEFISPNLIPVVSDIAEYCAREVSTPSSNQNEIGPKFIYFNKLNLAYKSTVHLDNKQTGNLACNKDSVKIMADLNDRKRFISPVGESIVKTMNDYWIVGKFSNFREIYIALQQKNASLIEISDEIAKLSENELKGIFFHDI